MFESNDRFKLARVTKKLEDMEKNVKESFRNLKSELEDHLDSINDNTNEVEYFAELMMEFDNRLTRMENAIFSMTSKVNQIIPDDNHPRSAKLTDKEADVFQIIFRSENEPVGLNDLSKQTNITENNVKKIVQNMIEKQIPIISTDTTNGRFFYVEESFREKQLKFNVLNLSTNLTLDVFDQSIKEIE